MLKVYIQLGGGERSLCFLSTFLFVVFALFTSMADKQFIDFGIEEVSTFTTPLIFRNCLMNKETIVFKPGSAVSGFDVGQDFDAGWS